MDIVLKIAEDFPDLIDDFRRNLQEAQSVDVIEQENTGTVVKRGRKRKGEEFDHEAWIAENAPGLYAPRTITSVAL